MTDLSKLSLAIERAFSWHKGVEYGCGLSMTNQLNGTANAIDQFYTGSDKKDILITALLSKAWEASRQNEITKNNPQSRTSYEALVEDFGNSIADNIKALSTEPDTKDWHEIAMWASKQNQQVQTVLLAEKLQNFIVSRDRPNPKKSPDWHINYYNTRMIVVEALREACPALYVECVKVSEQGLKTQKRNLFEITNGGQRKVPSFEKIYMSNHDNGRI
ncbi:MAG: hypothetical protein IKV03_02750 [Alphaproteobacteria bacterium]|nr:hypothetical protein [Alphaproteobacteria bacterium]